MGALAPRAILLLSAAASLGQAYFQIAKELLPLAQTPLHPLVLGEPGPASAVSPLTPLGYGLAQNTSDDFLVYHSPGFAGGRGISIVTTPARIQRFAKVRAPSYANDFSSPPYEERPMPGKGRGLVATKTLHRGDRIFADTPILLLDAEAFGGGGDDDDYDDDDDEEEVEGVEVEEEQEEDEIHSELAALAVSKLPPPMQRQFWNLHAQAGDDPVMDRIDPNAFELHIGGDAFFGVLPEMARLNHDCRPNAVYSFDEATLTQRVHALADIAPGEEISIAYISPVQSRAERLDALRASWGFECSCSACSLPPELTALSDRRVAETDRLLERLRGDGDGDGGEDDTKQKPQVAEALVSLFRQERLWADAHEGWVLAARAYCAAGNYWDTLRHAHLAAEASALWGGAGSPDAVEMARLAEAPEGEACWMKAVKS
ncbi:lysine methyltransferase [Metarhizium guizhouense ARSEF 977]|uniref:Lysine methyltransferase n=1 Tax=Metarhizium guizhouense (strain ARSEF 977) TaxID=1276136 RepID=A0A0B4GYD5_METGA|nr:lysine methyltransferase [Metarhizium guizhouense ARSEF 977]